MTRIQGTDGVRKFTALSTDTPVRGLSPQAAFIEKDVMTEEFMELYSYCRTRQLIEGGFAEPGMAMAVGWDPRDKSGVFTDAVVSGIVKGGLDAVLAGMAPTPAIALYARHAGMGGAFVVTASHNPSAYNGIKIFTKRGLKLLPGDDEALSALVLSTDYRQVKSMVPAGRIEDHSARLPVFFEAFSLDAKNSWITNRSCLSHVTVVADFANGAFSRMGERILMKAGFGDIITVNADEGGLINERCGVSEIEGVAEITPDQAGPKGRFNGNRIVGTMFRLGNDNRQKIKNGQMALCGAVFDGDGDRFYRLDFDPFAGSIIVLSGDETAALQAQFLRERGAHGLFVNTVESDLNAIVSAERMGFKTAITSVGDKWILLNATLSAIKPVVDADVWKKIESIAVSEKPSADAIEKILDETGVTMATPDKISFMIGGEESGHSITPAVMSVGGALTSAFAGNGMKCLLNTFAATFCGGGFVDLPVMEKYARLRAPFPAGFKKTMYVYYVDKSRWERGLPLWELVKADAMAGVAEIFGNTAAEDIRRPEEPDMLYIKISTPDGPAALFARNSGTEDKTGVNLRGPATAAADMLKLGERAFRVIMAQMKDHEKPMARAERELIEQASKSGAPRSAVGGLTAQDYDRLLAESGVKQSLLEGVYPGALLTERGRWYHETMKAAK
jgi:phosphomannomutase